MYSRTIGRSEASGNIRLNPELTVNKSQRQGIPVRSFSDNLAYERFNNLGNKTKHSKHENSYEKKTDTSVGITDLENNDDGTKIEEVNRQIPLAVSEQHDRNDDASKILTEDNHHVREKLLHEDIFSIMKFFDSDFFLILFAAAIAFLGNNETNDKLTPIALLAIMFLN